MVTRKYSKKLDGQNPQPQLGRPALPVDQQRKNRVVTFLTDPQLECLAKKAERKGLSLSRTCYDIIRDHLD
jgi:hypothetical protein